MQRSTLSLFTLLCMIVILTACAPNKRFQTIGCYSFQEATPPTPTSYSTQNQIDFCAMDRNCEPALSTNP